MTHDQEYIIAVYTLRGYKPGQIAEDMGLPEEAIAEVMQGIWQNIDWWRGFLRIKEARSTTSHARDYDTDKWWLKAPKWRRRAQDAKAFICANYMRSDVRLKDVAAVMGVSARLATDIAKANCGKTVTALIADTRMNAAKRLLMTTEYTMQDIAAQVGYKSAAAFGMAFARRYGISPNDYRRKHEKRTRNSNGYNAKNDV